MSIWLHSLPGSEQRWWEFTAATPVSRDWGFARQRVLLLCPGKGISHCITLFLHPQLCCHFNLLIFANTTNDLLQPFTSCSSLPLWGAPILLTPNPQFCIVHIFSTGLPLHWTPWHSAFSLSWTEHLGCTKYLSKGSTGKYKKKKL